MHVGFIYKKSNYFLDPSWRWNFQILKWWVKNECKVWFFWWFLGWSQGQRFHKIKITCDISILPTQRTNMVSEKHPTLVYTHGWGIPKIGASDLNSTPCLGPLFRKCHHLGPFPYTKCIMNRSCVYMVCF